MSLWREVLELLEADYGDDDEEFKTGRHTV